MSAAVASRKMIESSDSPRSRSVRAFSAPVGRDRALIQRFKSSMRGFSRSQNVSGRGEYSSTRTTSIGSAHLAELVRESQRPPIETSFDVKRERRPVGLDVFAFELDRA